MAGVTLRPGGEALTRHGLKLCGLLSCEGRFPSRDSDAEEQSKKRNPPPAVLDVGCGAGATVALLASLGFRATGVDPSPALLNEATGTTACGHDAFSPVFLPGRADRLPVDDASQDAVLCECVLSLTPDPAAALAEMVRVLHPGGTLLLSDVYVRFPLTSADNMTAHTPRNSASSHADDMTGGMELRRRSGGSCLAGAVPVEMLRPLLARQGFSILAEEDHSRALAELAARLVLGGGSLDELAAWLGASCSSCQTLSNRDLLRRLGYILLVARKI